LCFQRGPFFVQGSWGNYASLDQWSGNLKKFLLVVSDMGLPGFSVKHLDEVRALSSHEIVGIHSSVTTFYFPFFLPTVLVKQNYKNGCLYVTMLLRLVTL
jgi:hypothetical protein